MKPTKHKWSYKNLPRPLDCNDFDFPNDKRVVRITTVEVPVAHFLPFILVFSHVNCLLFYFTLGDLEVCRNLVRMGAAIAQACHATTTTTTSGGTIPMGPGLMELLLQAAAHPSVDVSGIALEVLEGQVVGKGDDGAGLVHQLLPILQGRAIAAHSFPTTTTSSIRPSLIPEDLPEYNGYLAFDLFRRTCLTDCLLACYRAQPDVYMTSCMAAIEEFCTPQATLQVSFHLEAALFCVGAVCSEVVPAVMKADVNSETEASSSTSLKDALTKCTLALSKRGPSLEANPLTLAQACCFLQKVRR